MDFNSFLSDGNKNNDEIKKEIPKDIYNLAEEMMKKYNGKSEGEIMTDLLAMAMERKKAGTLTNAEIDAFVSAVTPMLNGSQKKKLEQIVKKLKN